MGLSYLQELTIRSEVKHYMGVALANNVYQGMLEAYFLLIKFHKHTDLILEIVKDILPEENYNKVHTYWSTHTLPIDVWVQDILWEVRNKKDMGLKLPDGDTIPISDEELKCKIINFIRIINYTCPLMAKELVINLRREFPEYNDVLMMFNDIEVKDEKVEGAQFYELSTLPFSSVLPLSYNETEVLYKPRYIVEAVDNSNNSIISRREFQSLKEAKLFKSTMEQAISLKDREEIDIVMTKVIGSKLSESINLEK